MPLSGQVWADVVGHHFQHEAVLGPMVDIEPQVTFTDAAVVVLPWVISPFVILGCISTKVNSQLDVGLGLC